MNIPILRFNLRMLSPLIITPLLLAGCLGSGGSGSDAANASGSPGGPAVSAPGTCTTVTYAAPSGAASNIVFTFNKAYTCGQFANGDWWVSVDGSGFVTVNSITPDRAVLGDGFEHHGYELYPQRDVAGVAIVPQNVADQAFDSNPAVDVNYNLALRPANLPLNVPGQTSLVKAVSRIPAPDTNTRPHIQFAAVLTVLSAPLANSVQFFRPPYFGASKPLYNVSSIRWNLIPKFAASSVTGTDKPSFATVAANFRGVRLDHYVNFDGRDMHPLDSMPNYGSDIASQNATNLLRMAIDDFDITSASHQQALINYLQMAIDLLGMANNGTTWAMTGGHGNGRKLPLAFAAWIMNSTDFTNAINNSIFAEDILIVRSTPFPTRILFGQDKSEGQYWQHLLSFFANQLNPAGCPSIGSKDIRDPYGYIDGGSEPGAEYQSVNSAPWKYTVLAYKYMFPINAEFNNPLLADYIYRLFVTTGPIGNGAYDSCAPVDTTGFNPVTCSFPNFSTVANGYTGTFGPADGSGTNCKAGGGRLPTYVSTKLDVDPPPGYGVAGLFGENLWYWYKTNNAFP